LTIFFLLFLTKCHSTFWPPLFSTAGRTNDSNVGKLSSLARWRGVGREINGRWHDQTLGVGLTNVLPVCKCQINLTGNGLLLFTLIYEQGGTQVNLSGWHKRFCYWTLSWSLDVGTVKKIIDYYHLYNVC
jgi:hypothetical protein